MSRPPHEILIRPIVTEKTSSLQSEGTDATVPESVRDRADPRGKFTFEVAPDATKIDIRRAVEQLFEVKVTRVRTMNVRGKKRRLGRSMGRKPHWKKAIVEVAGGETLELFEGV